MSPFQGYSTSVPSENHRFTPEAKTFRGSATFQTRAPCTDPRVYTHGFVAAPRLSRFTGRPRSTAFLLPKQEFNDGLRRLAIRCGGTGRRGLLTAVFALVCDRLPPLRADRSLDNRWLTIVRLARVFGHHSRPFPNPRWLCPTASN